MSNSHEVNLQFKQRRTNQSVRRFVSMALILIIIVILFLAVQFVVNILPHGPGKPLHNVRQPFYATETIQIDPGAKKNINIAGYEIVSDELPGYIQVESEQLVLQPQKYDAGISKLYLRRADPEAELPHLKVLSLRVGPKKSPDMAALKADILNILGDQKDVYGVVVKDLLYGYHLEHNQEKVLLPGSLAKVPVVILALRDIDAGKLSYDDKFPVKTELKHSTYDDIGRLPAGTLLPLRTYIYETFHTSNNTAMYHLRDILGGILEVDARTRSELGVNTFMDAPSHVAIARNVAKVFEDVYRGKLLSKESTDYFYKLLDEAVPSLREGIPAGTPGDDQIVIATKVGFLYGKGLNSFVDAGIIFAPTSDYILVVLDEKTSVGSGKSKIKQIAAKVYEYLNWAN